MTLFNLYMGKVIECMKKDKDFISSGDISFRLSFCVFFIYTRPAFQRTG